MVNNVHSRYVLIALYKKRHSNGIIKIKTLSLNKLSFSALIKHVYLFLNIYCKNEFRFKFLFYHKNKNYHSIFKINNHSFIHSKNEPNVTLYRSFQASLVVALLQLGELVRRRVVAVVVQRARLVDVALRQ